MGALAGWESECHTGARSPRRRERGGLRGTLRKDGRNPSAGTTYAGPLAAGTSRTVAARMWAWAEYRKKEVEAKQKLRQVRKDLRRDINALENKLKWANIAGMPILVSLIGIANALIHRNRTRAQ